MKSASLRDAQTRPERNADEYLQYSTTALMMLTVVDFRASGGVAVGIRPCVLWEENCGNHVESFFGRG